MKASKDTRTSSIPGGQRLPALSETGASFLGHRKSGRRPPTGILVCSYGHGLGRFWLPLNAGARNAAGYLETPITPVLTASFGSLFRNPSKDTPPRSPCDTQTAARPKLAADLCGDRQSCKCGAQRCRLEVPAVKEAARYDPQTTRQGFRKTRCQIKVENHVWTQIRMLVVYARVS